MGSLSISAEVAQAQSPASLGSILAPISAELAQVEDLLNSQVIEFPAGIRSYVSYVLGGGGKRLRPTLVLLAGAATGRIRPEHLKLGLIVELIHIATLVHDDVLDEASMRHGIATANARWGSEPSVLLGDCLFAHALKLASEYPSTLVCRKISEAANAVCAGELLQNQHQFDIDLGRKEYLDILRLKTGALFAVSCELGAVLNGAPSSVVESLTGYGANLGTAYQIFDDCVDLFGHEHQAGKSLGTDVKKGKLTLPSLLLLEQAQGRERERLAAMLSRDGHDTHAELRALVASRGVARQAVAAVEEYTRAAGNHLAGIPDNEHGRLLTDLLGFLNTETRRILAVRGAE
jgi:octaprenyl-diphosphate synthase